MSYLIAYDSLNKGMDMSGTATGGGFLFNDSSISTTYVGAVDWDTVLFSVSGAGPVKYFVVSGTVNTHTGNAVLSELIYADSNWNPLFSWTDADLHVNLYDDFSLGINYTILNTSDYIYGNNYSDIIKAGSGNDFVFGRSGNDTLYGESGSDTLYGESGNDTLIGAIGNDFLNGGLGADTLYGGLGQDLLYGGSDTVRDVFDFNTVTESKVGSTRDKIYNFVTGKDDIDLSGIDANTKASGNQAFKFGGTTKVANGVWYEKSGADLLVHADINGDKVSDMDIQIVGASKLVATDFVL